jgi:hypothetical protein
MYLAFRKLQKELEEEVANISHSLCQGMAASYEDYRAKVGQIRGVTLAIEALKETLQKLEHDDD